MKVELIEEKKIASGTMYVIAIDGNEKKWFAKKEDAETFYKMILDNPSMIYDERNILQSQEIEVSLPLSNQ